MGKKTFTAELSVKGIENLKKELLKYQKGLDYKCKWIAETLAERGVEIAVMQVFGLDAIFTGELIDSIHTQYEGKTLDKGHSYAIVAGSEHAVFVEFGTGQRGIDEPYPYKLPEGVTWNYATGKTIRKNIITGRYYWFYPGNDGLWHYTEGMPARPFMYNTALELRQREIIEVIKQAFK